MYEEYEVYGPYSRPDGRLHVCLYNKETQERITISYPKYRMECLLNRKLEKNEEVHHKDLNYANNEDSNFEIRNGTDHRIFHQTKYFPEIYVCEYCGRQWLATAMQVRNRESNIRRGRSLTGPFCSKSCSGKVNH